MRRISQILLAGLLLSLGVGCGPSEIPADAVVEAVFFWSDT
jgi:hypothetical protein